MKSYFNDVVYNNFQFTLSYQQRMLSCPQRQLLDEQSSVQLQCWRKQIQEWDVYFYADQTALCACLCFKRKVKSKREPDLQFLPASV